MTFGFPAHHKDSIPVDSYGVELERRVITTLEKLSWELIYQKNLTFEASSKVNIWSWGEKISINITKDNMLTITSKCALKTQAIDWGKNKRNVKKFIKEFNSNA